MSPDCKRLPPTMDICNNSHKYNVTYNIKYLNRKNIKFTPREIKFFKYRYINVLNAFYVNYATQSSWRITFVSSKSLTEASNFKHSIHLYTLIICVARFASHYKITCVCIQNVKPLYYISQQLDIQCINNTEIQKVIKNNTSKL